MIILTASIRENKYVLSFLTLIIFLLVSSPLASKASVNTPAAKNYLTSSPLNPWSVMALAASGQNPTDINFLKNVSGNEAINFAAPVLAITATGNDPRNFSDTNLVSKLKSYFKNNQLGDINSLNDDIFGLLALVSSGEESDSEIISSSKNYILSNQNSDGSWGFSIGSGDTDITAAGIVALKASGVPTSDPSIQKALHYIKQNQTSEGGFLASPAFDTSANSASTAWAIWAFNSLGIDPKTISKENKNPIEYLESAQNQNGSFSYTKGSMEDSFTPNITSYSLIALSGKTLPLKIFKEPQEQYEFRIEGKNSTVCQGHTTGPTALDIVKNASNSCGFSFNIANTQYGPYLEQINGDKAAGLIGWQYAVNNEAPSVGAADYSLKTGDSLLWYFGSWDDKITRLNLSNTQISSGQSAIATVEYKEAGSWKRLKDAEISPGASELTTDQLGQAFLSLSDGYYQIFANKTNFVRSNTVLLKIGQPLSSIAALSATIGQVNGAENENSETNKGVSFTISADNLDFGNLSKAQVSEKILTISNNGSINLTISSVVEGDDLFKENFKLQNKPWKNFEASLNADQNKDINTKLSVPLNYEGTGKKNGQLIFWAKSEN